MAKLKLREAKPHAHSHVVSSTAAQMMRRKPLKRRLLPLLVVASLLGHRAQTLGKLRKA